MKIQNVSLEVCKVPHPFNLEDREFNRIICRWEANGVKYTATSSAFQNPIESYIFSDIFRRIATQIEEHSRKDPGT